VTPPQLAKELGVEAEKVLRWIKAGELRAVNTATRPNGKRPRWRISRDAIADFERRRASKATRRPPRPKRQPENDSRDYF
jgi:excisionase family DNA binding protein